MDFKQKNRHMVDILFVIALFCVFAVSALMLVMIGANVYKKTVQNMDQNYNTRTSFAYITEKIRQFDSKDAISIGSLEGNDTLILTTIANDTVYTTYIYRYDGYLKELFVKAGAEISLESGQNILPISDFRLKAINQHLFQFTLTSENDTTYNLYVCTRSQ